MCLSVPILLNLDLLSLFWQLQYNKNSSSKKSIYSKVVYKNWEAV